MNMQGMRIGLAGGLMLLALAACAPTTRFEWGAYEGSLYAYAKQPTQKEVFRTALVRAIERGKETNRVAPGMNAELGYLFLEDGDTQRAVALFEEEMRLFPESRKFLTSVVVRAKGEGKVPAAGTEGDSK
jgi:hypothetical protein